MTPCALVLALVLALLLTLPCSDGAPQQSPGLQAVNISSTQQLYAALSDQSVGTVLIHDSLVLNGSAWGRTLAISRSVVISATASRLAASTLVLFDFASLTMLFTIEPGYALTWRGLELVNHFDTVGPSFRPLRQSVGGWVVFDGCLQRRRAGLPYEAAVVNMVVATRPEGVAGPQVAFVVNDYSYSSTRSEARLTYSQAVSMFDYQTTVAPDSSLAFQGFYYGGYTYSAQRSIYAVDHFVQQSCLDTKPGGECVALLLQELDGPATRTDSGSGGEDKSSDIATIVPAVVVPVVVVLLLVALLLFVRRRRLRTAKLQHGSDIESMNGKTRGPSYVGGSGQEGGSAGVFMGLEENQPLPEWSALAADVEDGEDEEDHGVQHTDDSTFQLADSMSAEQQQLRQQHQQQQAGLEPGQEQPAQQEAQQQRRLGAKQPAQLVSGAPAGKGSRRHLLRPALSSQLPDGEERKEGGGAAAAGADSNGEAGESSGAHVIVAASKQQAPPGEPQADMLAELGRMAQELRNNVKDVAIKLEGVIGSGSFGTVYRGTWQGLPVAIKTVIFTASQDSRRRALSEAALCQSISHPNIVATYASELQPIGNVSPPSGGSASADPSDGTSSGFLGRNLPQIVDWRLYIVQEFADGGPLRRLYGNKQIWPGGGQVDLPAVVGIALGIARALTHLHSKRIIHGDLNPNNVLLKRDAAEPSGYAVKVGDFGLSVLLPQNRTHLSNLRMGTMFYMCPAVVLKAQVGPSSDVFSLGVMLWELYNGRRAGIRTPEGPRYSSIFPAFPPTCPEAYRAVTLHCLQRQPQNRPLAAAVEEHLEQLMDSIRADGMAGGEREVI